MIFLGLLYLGHSTIPAPSGGHLVTIEIDGDTDGGRPSEKRSERVPREHGPGDARVAGFLAAAFLGAQDDLDAVLQRA